MQTFRSIAPEELKMNPFQAIGTDWMLITAKNGASLNPMTASWGGLGVLWKRPVAFAFIRPQRFTRELVDASDTFSLCFLDGSYRKQLSLCGVESGREIDKMAACGFTAAQDGETGYIEQSHTVIICKKLSRQPMVPEMFIDDTFNAEFYPEKDHHNVYVGEVLKVLVRE